METVHKASAGQSIPIKFSLGADFGLVFTAVIVPVQQPLARPLPLRPRSNGFGGIASYALRRDDDKGYQPFSGSAHLIVTPPAAGSALRAGCNPVAPLCVRTTSFNVSRRFGMSFLKRLFSPNAPTPAQRVRICVECGMPVADHKDWCSIRRGQAEMERRKAEGQ